MRDQLENFRACNMQRRALGEKVADAIRPNEGRIEHGDPPIRRAGKTGVVRARFRAEAIVHGWHYFIEQKIGKKIAVQDGWILEEGPHKGQQGYYLPNSTVGLIPASDLKEIRIIPYAQWKDIFNRTKQ